MPKQPWKAGGDASSATPSSGIHDGMRVDWDVPIEMEDGVVLRADVYRPLAEGLYPVILSHGPYGKGLAFQEGYPDQWNLMVREHPDVAAGSSNRYQNWEVVDPERWVQGGYVCVRVDSRGAGRSPGFLDCYSERETLDMYACIEWAAVQPWSNGKVGLNGISYYAINQWEVASLRPPHLAAMCAWEGAADFYRDMTYHGGIRSTFFEKWYPEQVTGVQHGLGSRGARSPITGELVAGPETLVDDELARNRGDLGADVRAHPLDDEFHRARSAHWEKIDVPLLSAGNWGGHGLHLRGNVEAFVRAASREKWLECHGLEHWTHFYTDYGLDLQRRFFDHFLKGEQNGWEKQPRVLLQVRHPGGEYVQRDEAEWPLARTQWTRLYLDAATQSLRREPPSSASTVSYDGLGEGVTFLLEPFDEPTEITGPLAAKLFVSSDTVDADLMLIVRLFDSAGEEVLFQGALDPHSPLAQGWLRASHRKLDETLTLPYRPYHTHDEVQPLTPGEIYELDVEIWPTCISVPAGYRIALTVQGTDFDYGGEPARNGWMVMRGCGPFLHDDQDDRPPEVFGGRVSLHTGDGHASFVLVPVIPERR